MALRRNTERVRCTDVTNDTVEAQVIGQEILGERIYQRSQFDACDFSPKVGMEFDVVTTFTPDKVHGPRAGVFNVVGIANVIPA